MMWTRKALKEQAKEALRRNYWKIVLVSSLLLFLGGGVSFTGVGSSNREVISQDAEDVEDIEDIEEDISGKENYFVKIDTEQGEVHWGAKERNMPSGVWIIATIIGVIIFISIFLFILVLIFLVDIFLWNPFSVGVERFMLAGSGIGERGALNAEKELKMVSHTKIPDYNAGNLCQR